jgi:hypothetical protein
MTLFTKTYDGIIKGFTKTINDLRDLADKNVGKITSNNDKLFKLEVETTNLKDESKKALLTADKLAALLE